jgi:hypothetical protein
MNIFLNYSEKNCPVNSLEDIINMIRSYHVHLSNKHDIIMVLTFPCYKVSLRFPSITLLTDNITL